MNPYEVLGVPTDADDDALTEAYRNKSKQHHPDRNPGDDGAPDRFSLVQTAYAVLSDPTRREAYDRDGTTHAPRPKPELDFLEPLHQIFLSVASQYGSAARTYDLVAETKKRLTGIIRDIEQQVGQVQQKIKALEDLITRLTVDDGENLLAASLRSEVGGHRITLEKAAAELDKLTRAKAHLAKYSFRKDTGSGSAGWAVFGLTTSTTC